MPADTSSVSYRVGSRKSKLALIQTDFVISQLGRMFPEHSFTVVQMSTLGDNVLDKALSKIGEKSLFTKELEVALEAKQVDFVVHSMKDLPTTLPPGLVIGAVLERENPSDAVVIKKCLSESVSSLAELPPGSVVGTSSLRRASQLKANFPDLVFQDVRGNLNTRLQKLDSPTGPYSALILAAAGILRMDWGNRVSQYLGPEVCMHAVGQGALAVECRATDKDTLTLLANLHHRETVLQTIAERAFMKTLEGGCSVPLGVTSKVLDNSVELHGGVWSLDGSRSVVSSSKENFDEDDDLEDGCSPPKRVCPNSAVNFSAVFAEQLPHSQLKAAEKCGVLLAKDLISKGADVILKEVKAKPINQPPTVPDAAKEKGDENISVATR